jgi:hypothetical protein
VAATAPALHADHMAMACMYAGAIKSLDQLSDDDFRKKAQPRFTELEKVMSSADELWHDLVTEALP